MSDMNPGGSYCIGLVHHKDKDKVGIKNDSSETETGAVHIKCVSRILNHIPEVLTQTKSCALSRSSRLVSARGTTAMRIGPAV